jgi:hypothetical protein
MKQNTVYGAIAVLAIFALGFGYVYHKINNEDPADSAQFVPPPKANPTVEEGKPTTSLGSTGLSVSTQTAGRTVTIDSAKITTNSFIAIFESNSGKPGKFVGSSALLTPGDKQDLEIRAAVSKGKTYIASMYQDDGNKRFDANKDSLVLDSKGQALSRTFSVQ